jgi:hypothetical protein
MLSIGNLPDTYPLLILHPHLGLHVMRLLGKPCCCMYGVEIQSDLAVADDVFVRHSQVRLAGERHWDNKVSDATAPL